MRDLYKDVVAEMCGETVNYDKIQMEYEVASFIMGVGLEWVIDSYEHVGRLTELDAFSCDDEEKDDA